MIDRRPKVGMKVRLPSDLHAQVSLILMNDRTGVVEYGAWTGLFEQLLRRWLDEQRLAVRSAAQ